MYRPFFAGARLPFDKDKGDKGPTSRFFPNNGELGALPFPVHRVEGTGGPSWFVRRYLVPQALHRLGLEALEGRTPSPLGSLYRTAVVAGCSWFDAPLGQKEDGGGSD